MVLETYGFGHRPPLPDELPEKRWLAYGSSITNGAFPGLHHNSYIYHAARIAGLDVLNHGISGSCLCDLGDLTTDLIHPSGYGHARMGRLLGDQLRRSTAIVRLLHREKSSARFEQLDAFKVF